MAEKKPGRGGILWKPIWRSRNSGTSPRTSHVLHFSVTYENGPLITFTTHGLKFTLHESSHEAKKSALLNYPKICFCLLVSYLILHCQKSSLLKKSQNILEDWKWEGKQREIVKVVRHTIFRVNFAFNWNEIHFCLSCLVIIKLWSYSFPLKPWIEIGHRGPECKVFRPNSWHSCLCSNVRALARIRVWF